MEFSVNYLALLVCGVANMILGALWWSQLVLGKPWMKAMGWDKKSEKEIKDMQKEALPGYAVSFISTLIIAFVLSHVLQIATVETFTEAIQTGAWMWFGFVATTGATLMMFSGKKSCPLYFINYGYFLVSFIMMGSILFWMS